MMKSDLGTSLRASALVIAAMFTLSACDGLPGSNKGSSTSAPAATSGAESGQTGATAPDTATGQVGAPGSTSRSDMTTSPDADATDDLKGSSPSPTPVH